MNQEGMAQSVGTVGPMTGLSHVQMRVTDVAASAEWYAATLGLEPFQADPAIGYVALRHQTSGVVIVLTADTSGSWNADGGGLDHLAFAVPDGATLEAWADHLTSIGIDHAGVVRERTGGALPGIVPSNTYTTGDGENIVIAGNGDAIFKRLMRAIERLDLADDPQLARNDGRVPRTVEIDDAISAWCATQTIRTQLADEQTVPSSAHAQMWALGDISKPPKRFGVMSRLRPDSRNAAAASSSRRRARSLFSAVAASLGKIARAAPL